MDADRRQHGERQRKLPSRAERGRRHEHDQCRRDDEAELVGHGHIEQQERRRQQSAQAVKLSGRRRRLAALDRNEFFFLFEGMADPERDREPAQRQTRSDHQRKHIGPDRLAGHRRQLPAALGGSGAEANEKHSRDTIGKTHGRTPRISTMSADQDQAFDRPAAFIATPIWASPLSMKVANSVASPHTVPKPRLLMMSLNSLESKTFFSDAVSLVATSAGRPLGPAMPRHAPGE